MGKYKIHNKEFEQILEIYSQNSTTIVNISVLFHLRTHFIFICFFAYIFVNI